MLPNDLSALATFLVVAEERSFTRAAKRQGVSPSAVSHSMRALEEEIGVRLLARTTRSVSPTEAGEQLLSRLRPALTEVDETLEEISGRRNKAAGRVRLLLPRLAIRSVLAPKLGKLSREYPDIILDVTTDDSRRDIVAEGFDAGIHFGEYIQKDMIAVRVSSGRGMRPALRCQQETRHLLWQALGRPNPFGGAGRHRMPVFREAGRSERMARDRGGSGRLIGASAARACAQA